MVAAAPRQLHKQGKQRSGLQRWSWYFIAWQPLARPQRGGRRLKGAVFDGEKGPR